MRPSNKTMVCTRQHPPYQAGKVQVGLTYIPPLRQRFSADEDRLQAALLASRTPGLTPAQKLAQAVFLACSWALATAVLAAALYLIVEL